MQKLPVKDVLCLRKDSWKLHIPLTAYDRMEEKLKSASKPIILPHCHLYANFFPDDFKGKIIHVTRDPRAVVTSAWHFMTKLPHYKHYFDSWVGCSE